MPKTRLAWYFWLTVYMTMIIMPINGKKIIASISTYIQKVKVRIYSNHTNRQRTCWIMSSLHCRLFCLVLSVSAVWTELATSQDCRRQKISKLNMFSISFLAFLSSLGMRYEQDLFPNAFTLQTGLNKTVQSPIYCGLLSCPCRRCVIGISEIEICLLAAEMWDKLNETGGRIVWGQEAADLTVTDLMSIVSRVMYSFV